MSEHRYPGAELDVFSSASNWKNYVRALVSPFLGSRVLEVGAGIGATTQALINSKVTKWICLEPDLDLAARIQKKIAIAELPHWCEVRSKTTREIEGEVFDCVLYIDVLEHIEQDEAELRQATTLLVPGGHIVVLSPAHQCLYSEFDREIGHYRRYNRRGIERLSVRGAELIKVRYLDSVGLLAAVANRVLLKSSMPTERQIRIWDGSMVLASRVVDPMIRYLIGKSIVAVWRRVDR